MSKFQIGPAKTRDGRDAFITEVGRYTISGYAPTLGTGTWLEVEWMGDGAAIQFKTSDIDLLPNVPEPEWTVYAVWDRPNREVPVWVRWVDENATLSEKYHARIRLRFVDGRLEAEVIE